MANFCQLSPGILSIKRALAVDDLVVRQGQDEVLGEGVDQAEAQAGRGVLAVDRVGFVEVAERVVHPAHVPLQAEPEPAEVGRSRDAPAKLVDSSAAVMIPGCSRWQISLSFLRKSIASRFSFPPKTLGTHSPAFLE